MKAVSKSHIVKNQQLTHLRAERDVLRQLDNPLIVRMFGSFQDDQCVYFVMEYVCGGEFFRHLKARGKLPEDMARFYAAEVVLAFEYLHGLDTIYRDLKPENLLLDAEGHLKITDFGFAKKISGKRTYTLCGTPDYLAPEIIMNKGHGKPVDWWSFGVLLFEMLAGYPPFYDDDITNTYKKILTGRFLFPAHMSVTSRDLIRKLLQADLTKRYGGLAGGIGDIKSHPFFKTTDWEAMKHRRMPAPIKPVMKSLEDTSNFDDYSILPPMQHEFALSKNEQAMFSEF
ncbi:hypothetical protein WJX72_002039 [[Myrmecia] bisecta]|uniref:Uncharacterized protein n=1 Tax=[Myrmecia] bisecta TaxID=41462 RepID=A0AAW1QQ05_9CHLO